MNHFEPQKVYKECIHESLYFGSGDYYLICENCGRYWVMVGPNGGDVGDSTISNIGEAAGLSGEKRVVDLKTEDY